MSVEWELAQIKKDTENIAKSFELISRSQERMAWAAELSAQASMMMVKLMGATVQVKVAAEGQRSEPVEMD